MTDIYIYIYRHIYVNEKCSITLVMKIKPNLKMAKWSLINIIQNADRILVRWTFSYIISTFSGKVPRWEEH